MSVVGTRAGWRQIRRRTEPYRRPAAALLAAATVASAVHAARPSPPPSSPLLVARGDLPAGRVLRLGDVRVVAQAGGPVPGGALRSPIQAVGHLLVAARRRGEPLTDVALLGPSLLAGYGHGTVGAPVRIADADAVALLRPGDAVDVLAAGAPADPLTGSQGAGDLRATARVVAAATRVITVPPAASTGLGGGAGGSEGALVLLATTPAVAAELAAAAVSAHLSLTLRGP